MPSHLLQAQKDQLVGRVAVHSSTGCLGKRFYKVPCGLPGLIGCMLGTRARGDWEGSGDSGKQMLGEMSYLINACFQNSWCFETVLLTSPLGRDTFKTSECSASSTLTSVLWPTAKPSGPSAPSSQASASCCQPPWEVYLSSLAESNTGETPVASESQLSLLNLCLFLTLTLLLCAGGLCHNV